MRPLLASLLAVAAGLIAWSGARYLNVPDAFGARLPRDSMQQATKAALYSGAPLPQGASQPGATGAAHAKAGEPKPASAAASPAKNTSGVAVGQTPRERLAALRTPLSPDAQNDPFSVLSWLPPPPPPPPAPVAAPVQEPPPAAPPLPFAYVGRLNGNPDKPQVFLSNGDQLLIVSPGEVIDGRYRFESIAPTEAVFTFLPLNERQVLTFDGEEQTK